MKNIFKKVLLASSFLMVTSDLAFSRGCPDAWARCKDGTSVKINYHQEHGIFSKCTPIAQGSGESIKHAIATCSNGGHGGFEMDSVPETSLDVVKTIVTSLKGAGEIAIVAGKIAIDVYTAVQAANGKTDAVADKNPLSPPTA